jgi:hypothetical protein
MLPSSVLTAADRGGPRTLTGCWTFENTSGTIEGGASTGGEGANDRNRSYNVRRWPKLEEGDLPGVPHPHHHSHQPNRKHV